MYTDKIILNFICKGKRARIAAIVLKKNIIESTTLPDFKIDCVVTPINTVRLYIELDTQILERASGTQRETHNSFLAKVQEQVNKIRRSFSTNGNATVRYS